MSSPPRTRAGRPSSSPTTASRPRPSAFTSTTAATRIPQLLARLGAGQRVALVTDAGTPGVSDPGVELVKACIEAGIPVDPIPGASAPLTAAVASGFPLEPLTILGFPPTRAKDRSAWFADTSLIKGSICFFEAPHRIARTLAEAAEYFGNRPILVARELTKVHQEFLRGTARELVDALGEPRGEFTVIVGPADKSNDLGEIQVSDQQLVDEFGS